MDLWSAARPDLLPRVVYKNTNEGHMHVGHARNEIALHFTAPYLRSHLHVQGTTGDCRTEKWCFGKVFNMKNGTYLTKGRTSCLLG